MKTVTQFDEERVDVDVRTSGSNCQTLKNYQEYYNLQKLIYLNITIMILY